MVRRENRAIASAQAALGALTNGRRIDLVFSDVMMPGGMNGVEFAKEIRQRHHDLPILLTSGYTTAFQAEANAVNVRMLAKPYRMEELQIVLAELTLGNGASTASL